MASSFQFNTDTAKSFGLLFLAGYSTYRTLPMFATMGACLAVAVAADYFLQQVPAESRVSGNFFSKATLANIQTGGVATYNNIADYATQRLSGIKTAP